MVRLMQFSAHNNKFCLLNTTNTLMKIILPTFMDVFSLILLLETFTK